MKLSREQKVTLYTNMVRVRKLDELLVQACTDGRLVRPIFHSQQGQEAIGVGVCTFLRPDDYVWQCHRGHGVAEVISKGLPAKSIIAEHYGKVTGSCRSLGFVSTSSIDRGIIGLCGSVGGGSTLSAGVALAAKLRKKGQVVVGLFGDGATGEGSLHTALLMSANWKLPVVWACSNNGMGMWVPTSVSFPKQNIADMAFGYGIPATIVDGQDVIAVYEAAQTAIDRARAGEGPSFIEFKTCRFRAHVEGHPDFSQNGLRDEAMVNEWKKRDPIILFRDKLIKDGTLQQIDIDCIEKECRMEVEDADRFALESPLPGPEILEDALYSK